MLKELLIRIVGITAVCALLDAALPQGGVSEEARRALRITETLLIAEPIIELVEKLI